MNANGHLLSDAQMQQFLLDGYLTLRLDVPDAFHQSIRSQMDDLLAREPNPGNNLLPRIPELVQVFTNEAVAGALESILGPDYQMEDHRYPHVNKPHSEPQKIHKDGARRGDHRVRRALGFYYPQDTSESHGPTGVLPGSQYYNDFPDKIPVLPLTGDAGVIVIAHYEIWHLATANNEDCARYMMKFQFTRTAEPKAPSWNMEEPEWSTDQQMLKTMWRWHQGEATTNGASSCSVKFDRNDLLARMNDSLEAVRNEAAYCLAALSEVGDRDAIVDDLMALLTGPAAEAAQSAVYGLAAIGAAAVDRLIPLLDNEGDALRFTVHALSEMGSQAAGAESALRNTLKNEDPVIRRQVADALGNCQGAEADLTVPALVKLFTDSEKRVRRAAAASIARRAGQLGADASRDMVQVLKTALSNDNRYVRGLSSKALERIGTPEALEILISWLNVSRWCPLTTAESPY